MHQTADPPYALSAPAFRFPALAALAGRAPLGGEREAVLACLVAARLAQALCPPRALPAALRQARAGSARVWFSSVAVPAAMRIPMVRLIEATGRDDRPALAEALRQVMDVTAGTLDAAASSELQALERALLS